MDGKIQKLAGTTMMTIDEAVAHTGIGQNAFRKLWTIVKKAGRESKTIFSEIER